MSVMCTMVAVNTSAITQLEAFFVHVIWDTS